MHPTGRGLSDRGKRDRNEDDWHVDDALGLYVVCDGLGGRKAGDVAARMAIDGITAAVRAERDLLQAVRDGEAPPERLEAVLRAAIRAACSQVFEAAYSSVKFRGMGCTATAVLVVGEHAALGHVGDTRLYLVRRGRPHQLTRDHHIAAEMVEAGRAEPDDPRLAQFEKVLTRAIGTFRTVDVDTAPVFLLPGDHLVLCTDGSWTGPLGGDRLTALLSETDPKRVPAVVIDRANQAGGDDNTTVVVVTIGGEDLHPRDADSVVLAIRALGESPIFGGLSYRQRSLIAAAGTLCRYRDGAPVVERGDVLDEALVVVDGALYVREAVDRFGRGETLGWTRLASGSAPAKSAATAAGPTLILALEPEEARSLAWRRPWLGLTLYQALSAWGGGGHSDPL